MANPEEISLGNPEEIDLDADLDGGDTADYLDESPPDGPVPPGAEAGSPGEQGEDTSMFSEVEIHNFDPAAAAATAEASAQGRGPEQGVHAAVANAMQLNPQNE